MVPPLGRRGSLTVAFISHPIRRYPDAKAYELAKKVLILTDDLGGGTGYHILSLLKHLGTSSWSAEIASKRRSTTRIASEAPIHIIPSMSRFDMYPFAQLHNLVWINRYIHKSQPDLIHAYFFWSIMYGRVLKKLGKIRFLVENREDQGFNWGGHEYALLRATRSVPDRVVCVSEAVRKVVLEREGIEEERVAVIHNGVELIQGKPEKGLETRGELGFKEDNLIVGMVANFNRSVKGVEYFIASVPMILSKVPSARFLVLGRGNQEQVLRDMAKRLGIEPYIVFAGFQTDIDRYYEAMDISALTSMSEGLSITLLESMVHGLPVVVTRVGGNPEVVVDGKTGYLVPPKDVSSFAGRVIHLLLNPQLRIKMGQEGRLRVEQKYRIEDAAQKYLCLYQKLLHAES
jgi:glycosyltransferase involved in cell wall biosynthesis